MYNECERRKCGPYRSRYGMIFGVCRGIAEHLNFSVGWMRVLTVIAFIFTGFWPVGAGYLLAALLMKPAPVVPLETDEDAEFYNSYTTSRGMALGRLSRTYDSLERRMQRLESIVTDRKLRLGRTAQAVLT